MRLGFHLVSGGTDTHLILMDLTGTGITGKAAQDALGAAGITVNKNNVPFDTAKPTVTSGVRIGTAALTTRGMREGEMRRIASMMRRVMDDIGDEAVIQAVREESRELAWSFPIFKW
jgi:glycine hydroxymethyltransferase